MPAICLAYTVVMRKNQGVSIPDSTNPGYKVFLHVINQDRSCPKLFRKHSLELIVCYKKYLLVRKTMADMPNRVSLEREIIKAYALLRTKSFQILLFPSISLSVIPG